jgi:hypothetical protein
VVSAVWESEGQVKSEHSERIVDLAASLAAKADDLDQVLIIYRLKDRGEEDDTHGSMDNELELRDLLWLAEAFKQWLTLGAIGLLPKED